jgi:hypothetical protein
MIPETVAAVKENQERRSPELWRRGGQAVSKMELTREKSGVWGKRIKYWFVYTEYFVA